MDVARDGREFVDAFYAARASEQDAEAFVAKLPLFITASTAETTMEFMIAHLDEISAHVEQRVSEPWVHRAAVVVRSAEDIRQAVTAHTHAMQTALTTVTSATRSR